MGDNGLLVTTTVGGIGVEGGVGGGGVTVGQVETNNIKSRRTITADEREGEGGGERMRERKRERKRARV